MVAAGKTEYLAGKEESSPLAQHDGWNGLLTHFLVAGNVCNKLYQLGQGRSMMSSIRMSLCVSKDTHGSFFLSKPDESTQ